MRAPASIAIVVATATLTCAALATRAVAQDAEPDDKPAADDNQNPYDEPGAPGPAHPSAPTRLPVLARDGMLRLPGARFVMGSASPRAPANERPAHAVTVPTFWIDRTEVTVGAYTACVNAGTCARPPRASTACTFDAGDPELPVSCVHWHDADTFCRFSGKRLPTESEWEYAARGTFGLPFPWGRTTSCATAVTLLNEQTGSSCQRGPARVGSHAGGASIFGVQDLSGNVEEWTSDWYAESLAAGAAPRSGVAHVLRGGGWLSTPLQSRTTSRSWGSALEAGPNVGFRCARDD